MQSIYSRWSHMFHCGLLGTSYITRNDDQLGSYSLYFLLK